MPPLSSLAKDFAALAKKHGLIRARLYPVDGDDTHLMLSEGRILRYHQPKAKWTRLTDIDKRFAVSSQSLAKSVTRVGRAVEKATPGVAELIRCVSKLT